MTADRTTPDPDAPPSNPSDAGIAAQPLETHGRLSIIGWAAVLCVAALIPITVGVESALHFSDSAIDGPFRLYNALRRIAAGQRGGVDFQFFHGIGLPAAGR